MGNISKSERRRCHPSNDDYCAQNTELLLKHLDDLFADMTRDVEGQGGTAFESHGIKTHRHAIDKCDMLIHLTRMQLEVMRRSVKHNQDGLDALVAERSRLIRHVDGEIASKPLPTLPNEIIAQILYFLYWVEDGRDHDGWPTRGRMAAKNTTLQRLIADSAASPGWRDFVQRQIPLVIQCHGSMAEYANSINGNTGLVGYYPTVFLVSEVEEAEERLGYSLSSHLTTIFANLSESTDMEELEEIRRFPWHSLVMKSDEIGSSEKLTRDFVQRFRSKLANLYQLDLQSESISDQKAPTPTSNWIVGEDEELITNFASKLRVVRAPSGLIPSLRPVLRNVALLEIAIDFGDPDTVAARESVNVLLEGLAPYSNTLTVLNLVPARDFNNRCGTIHDMRSVRIARFRSIGEDPSSVESVQTAPEYPRLCRVAFPHLKQLKLSLPVPVIHDILSAMDCTSLSHLKIAISDIWSGDSMHPHLPRATIQEISPEFIQGVVPKLNSIAIRADYFYPMLRFYESLEAPDDTGEWFLPMLDSVELHVKDWQEVNLLVSAKRLVLNRLNTVTTKSIRSIKITGPSESLYSLCSKHIDTFKLFVPEVITCFHPWSGIDTW
ncbi:hypothetical protein SCHPADRAFT_993775 [Schizopora paradoxa]|uniref:Uncharacterized protein n=1 Tax=Schizopora paradoxa TaxID=27342 RepID=A0A0H2S2R8_9AGAM|nr:hypothetical protein SCHPADRAFT_993775 [Schizopora paradoxa]